MVWRDLLINTANLGCHPKAGVQVRILKGAPVFSNGYVVFVVIH